MHPPRGQSGALTLLFTCVGRRVELLQAFRAAARRLELGLRIIALDSDATAPALFCADEPVLVPRADEAAYLPAVLDTVRSRGVDALIPTADTDLPALSTQRAALDAVGCTALIAAPDVIATCRDKRATFRFLRAHGIDTPQTYTADEIRALPDPPFPLFSKPLAGSASQRVHKISDRLDLDYFLARYADLIFQEFVEGQEYTLDAYVGLGGTARCVVPRARWQVRSGEVAKGAVVKDLDIMRAGQRVVAALGPTVRGVVTIQCIVTQQRRIRFIEINPRFGGGAPMAIAAGADFPGWLLAELCGRTPAVEFDGFRHGLCMLRYDWSVFVPLEEDLAPAVRPPLRPPPAFE